jgi:chromosome segregation ATPase
MMGSRVVGPDPALGSMSLSEFLLLAQNPAEFAARLTAIREATEEMSRQSATLEAALGEHDAREAALTARDRELDERADAVAKREGACAASEAQTKRIQREQDARGAALSQQSAAIERQAQLIGEQRAALEQELRRAAKAIDALNTTVDQTGAA